MGLWSGILSFGVKAGFARMEARQDRMEGSIMEIGDWQREMGGLLNGVVELTTNVK